jgi:hypothetical protein
VALVVELRIKQVVVAQVELCMYRQLKYFLQVHTL